MTPESATTGYATPTDALQYFDARTLGDALGDANARLAPSDVVANANLQALLDAASGELEASVLRGQRYTAANLGELTGTGRAFLKRIVCYLAVYPLLWRRNPLGPKPDGLAWVEEQKQQLEQGAAVFGLLEAQRAGVASLVTRAAGDAQDRRRTVTRAGRLFGGH